MIISNGERMLSEAIAINPIRTPMYLRGMTGLIVAALPMVIFAAPARADDRPDRVTVIAIPGRGLQPQAVTDREGVVHLVYFKGEPASGDLFYVRGNPGAAEFSKPIRLNSQPGSAVAMGTIRGGQIALGRAGRVHVAWNGSQKARPANPIKGTPMLYARLNKDSGAFEPQRNLMRRSFYLDGGGSIAADAEGNVYVAWHATSEDVPEGEAGRRLWVARSRDDGATFAGEQPAIETKSGACGCCGTKALADRRGTLYVLYRAARGGIDRDMMLATSRDHGEHFQAASLEPWPVSMCPMSSESLFDTPAGVIAAWETKGHVAYARIDPQSLESARPVSPPGGGNRKHPAVAANLDGDTILVWAEDTGWNRGGSLAWQIFDRTGRATGEKGRVNDGIPVWGLPAVVARPDGTFMIIH
jgi:hypothetical protein